MNNLTNESELRKLGYTKEGKVYLKSSLGKPDRVIGDVKAGEDEAIDYFIRRFDLIRKKVDTMLEAMEKAENKGSYLMQVLHLKDSLHTFNAIGHFEELLDKLNAAEAEINSLIETNRVKNFELKKELLGNAVIAVQHEDVRDAIKGVKDIRFSWMTIGSVSKDVEEELEGQFQLILDNFQVIKDKYTEERTIEIEIRKQKLQILLETAGRLNTYPPEVEQSFYKMKKLEDEWKAVGNIPKVIYGPLFEQFKRIKKTITKYARKGPSGGGGGGGRGNYAPQPIFIPKYIPPHEEALYDSLKRRLDLIQEAEQLLNIDLRQANEMAKDIQARWKVAGQIPDKYKSEIFNQFNAISDRIFESSYLARVVHTKYPHFRTMPPAEQLEAKIDAMDEIILKEDLSVKIIQAEFDFMSPEERSTDENRSRFSRLNTSVRKLKMKFKILNELRRELDRLKNPGASYGYQQRDQGSYQSRPSYGGGGGSGYSQDRGGYNREGGSGGYNQDRGGYNRDSGSGSGERRPYSDRPPGGGSYTPRPGGNSYDRPPNRDSNQGGSGYGNRRDDNPPPKDPNSDTGGSNRY